MSNDFLSPGEYARVQRILLDGCGKYGAAAVERISDAFAIAAGLAPAVPPESPEQRPVFVFPGLTARPWHEASDYGFSRDVEASAAVIRRELENVLRGSNGFQPYRQDRFVPKGRWDAFYVRIGNTWFDENRKLCPQTFRILESGPRLAEVAMFSALSAGGHIAPHCGTWNCRITFHLGLVIPENCALRVGNETRVWQSGRLIVFDDTFDHEAWNKSDKTRYVLLFDVWHPDLSDIEVELLEQLREHAGIHDGKATVERIRADRIKHQKSGCRRIACKPASWEHAQGEVMSKIGVAVINASTVLPDNDVAVVIPALQTQVSEHLALAWGIDATLYFVPQGAPPPSGIWWLLILDNSDQAGMLGYHDLTDEGLPLGKVFARSDMVNGYNWTVTASHELLEMLIDPDINQTVFLQNATNGGTLYSYDICDPCESDRYGYPINGVVVSDFVFPTWFESFRAPGSVQFDATQQITQPFELAAGGYISVYEISSGNGWQQLGAAGDMPRDYPPRAPVGSRRERRRMQREQWLRSAIQAR